MSDGTETEVVLDWHSLQVRTAGRHWGYRNLLVLTDVDSGLVRAALDACDELLSGARGMRRGELPEGARFVAGAYLSPRLDREGRKIRTAVLWRLQRDAKVPASWLDQVGQALEAVLADDALHGLDVAAWNASSPDQRLDDHLRGELEAQLEATAGSAITLDLTGDPLPFDEVGEYVAPREVRPPGKPPAVHQAPSAWRSRPILVVVTLATILIMLLLLRSCLDPRGRHDGASPTLAPSSTESHSKSRMSYGPLASPTSAAPSRSRLADSATTSWLVASSNGDDFGMSCPRSGRRLRPPTPSWSTPWMRVWTRGQGGVRSGRTKAAVSSS